MTVAPGPATLDRLDGQAAFGSGAPPSGAAADDRSGRFWLVIDDHVRLAVKVALITGRPLLLEGPSGSGKSSLARAVANTLGWTYYEVVITSQTRLEELTGSVDVVRRLQQAELSARRDDVEFPTGLEPFIEPGVLWWAFDPRSAAGPAGRRDPGIPAAVPADDPSAVVLVDEIDKAEPDLPNNLLVPLGSSQLSAEGRDKAVEVTRPYPPLVVITSNQERDLPPAFLRRCVAIELTNPSPDQLVAIAQHHVGAGEDYVRGVLATLAGMGAGASMTAADFVDAVRAAHGLGLGPGPGDPRWAQVASILRRSSPSR